MAAATKTGFGSRGDRLAADDGKRARSASQGSGRRSDAGRADGRRIHSPGLRGRRSLTFAKQPLKMPVDIVAQHGIGDGPAFAGSLAVPFAHNRLGIKQVDGKLDEGWPLHAFARGRERFFDGGANVLNAPDLPEELHVRRGNGALFDVLQSAAPLQQRRRRPSQKHDGRLRELRILQRGYGIGDPGPRGDRHNARYARQPGDSSTRTRPWPRPGCL